MDDIPYLNYINRAQDPTKVLFNPEEGSPVEIVGEEPAPDMGPSPYESEQGPGKTIPVEGTTDWTPEDQALDEEVQYITLDEGEVTSGESIPEVLPGVRAGPLHETPTIIDLVKAAPLSPLTQTPGSTPATESDQWITTSSSEPAESESAGEKVQGGPATDESGQGDSKKGSVTDGEKLSQGNSEDWATTSSGESVEGDTKKGDDISQGKSSEWETVSSGESGEGEAKAPGGKADDKVVQFPGVWRKKESEDGDSNATSSRAAPSSTCSEGSSVESPMHFSSSPASSDPPSCYLDRSASRSASPVTPEKSITPVTTSGDSTPIRSMDPPGSPSSEEGQAPGPLKLIPQNRESDCSKVDSPESPTQSPARVISSTPVRSADDSVISAYVREGGELDVTLSQSQLPDSSQLSTVLDVTPLQSAQEVPRYLAVLVRI